MKIALVITDNRENFRDYGKAAPYFHPAIEALLEGFGALPEEEVHVISCIQRRISSPEKLAANIWFHPLHVPKIGWLRTGYQGCIRAVRREVSRLKPDIVHGQGTERDCAIASVFSGRPNVLTVHGNMQLIARLHRAAPFSFEWLSARLERFTIPRSGGVVCISRYTEQAVQACARRTWLLPNAVNQAFFEIDRKPLQAPDRFLLCVGQISFRKNQNDFIRALDPIAEELGLRLSFAGGIDDRVPYCREFLDLVAARPWCTFLGSKSREALRHIFAEATALALPSKEDNCPMVVLEAMASGVPVLAAEVAGVPELVKPDATGFLFPPDHPEQMQQAVRKIWLEPSTAARLSAAARLEAENRFLPRRVAERHIGIYREVCASS